MNTGKGTLFFFVWVGNLYISLVCEVRYIAWLDTHWLGIEMKHCKLTFDCVRIVICFWIVAICRSGTVFLQGAHLS